MLLPEHKATLNRLVNVRLQDAHDPETREVLRHSVVQAEEVNGRVVLVGYQQCGGGRRIIRKRIGGV